MESVYIVFFVNDSSLHIVEYLHLGGAVREIPESDTCSKEL